MDVGQMGKYPPTRESGSETDLYYNRAGYYDPQAGRFISEDPLEFAGSGPDFYVYVNNNSVDWVDPSGMGLTWRVGRPSAPPKRMPLNFRETHSRLIR